MSGDLFRPVAIVDGDTARASEEVAADMTQHLRERAELHGAVDAFVVGGGAALGGLRYIGGTRGHAAVVEILRQWLGQAEALAELSAVPAGTVLQ